MKTRIYKILNFIGVIAVIAINTLAVTLPINGVTTGQVSADNENLFTPAGFTFSVWSVIYLGLLLFGFVQVFSSFKNSESQSTQVTRLIGPLFIINCLANIFWILAWHHYMIGLSVIIMIVLLASLILINLNLNSMKNTTLNVWTAKVPLGLYFGWICVATIANFSVFFTSIDWNGFGISDEIYAIALYNIAGIVAIFIIHSVSTYAPAFTIGWGLYGIYSKLGNTGKPEYLEYTTLAVITAIIIAIIHLYFHNRKKLLLNRGNS